MSSLPAKPSLCYPLGPYVFLSVFFYPLTVYLCYPLGSYCKPVAGLFVFLLLFLKTSVTPVTLQFETLDKKNLQPVTEYCGFQYEAVPVPIQLRCAHTTTLKTL
jgi:hypothetical protein